MISKVAFPSIGQTSIGPETSSVALQAAFVKFTSKDWLRLLKTSKKLSKVLKWKAGVKRRRRIFHSSPYSMNIINKNIKKYCKKICCILFEFLNFKFN